LAATEGAEQDSVGRVVLTAGVTLAQGNRVGEVKPGVNDPFKRHVLLRRLVWDGFIAHTTGYNSHPNQPLS
jgi:hypothetical protein